MIRVDNVSLSYGEKDVLKNLTFALDENKITVILGESGSGKTSILNILAGKLNYKGQIFDIPERISYVYQNARLIPSISIFQNIDFVLASYMTEAERKKCITEVLSIVELLEFKDKYPNELSGGMQQRVALARAFCYESKLLLLDEPFTALDIGLKKRLIKVLLDLLEAKPKTTVLVTHSIDEALLLADNVLVLDKLTGNISSQIKISLPQKERTLSNASMAEYRQLIFEALKI